MGVMRFAEKGGCMAPKNEAVYLFLTGLANSRKQKKQLFELAEEMPELVIAYIDSLGDGWESTDSGDLLIKLRRIADEALADKKPE
jgi:hypothetical protein